MDKKQVSDSPETEQSLKKGQGFNNARGEVSDKQDTPAHNGQNVNNDPSHIREKEKNREQKSKP